MRTMPPHDLVAFWFIADGIGLFIAWQIAAVADSDVSESDWETISVQEPAGGLGGHRSDYLLPL